MLADLGQVHFDRFELLPPLVPQQHPDFLVQLFGGNGLRLGGSVMPQAMALLPRSA